MESRNLARLKNDEQALDLADTFEVMPGYLPNWDEERLALVRSHLQCYHKYGAETFDYLSVLDMADEEFMATLPLYQTSVVLPGRTNETTNCPNRCGSSCWRDRSLGGDDIQRR